MKRVISLVLCLMLVLSLTTTAFAQDVDSQESGYAVITIANAAKGETYSIYKLFDAEVSDDGSSIAYSGDIPTVLSDYFKKDEKTGAISVAAGYVTTSGEMTEILINALLGWANTVEPTATAVSDGSELSFENLKYGYYVVKTTQGTAISVTSTQPNATVYDKNSKEPNIEKSVLDIDHTIGDTIYYTATADTANYLGAGTAAKKVTKYEISDTLPEFLEDVEITSITVGGVEIKTADDQVPQFDENKKITIEWVDEDGTSLYANGAQIVISYTAKLTENVVVDGTEGNVNTVVLQPYVEDDDGDTPWEETWEDSESVFTYAVALEKIDGQTGNALAGAKFAGYGLIVNGENGVYNVVSFDPNSNELGTEMECDMEGDLVILGLASDVTLKLEETEAPEGYNKLTLPVQVNAKKIGEVVKVEMSKIYYDKDGNVTDEVTESYVEVLQYNEKLEALAIEIVNNAGSTLPSTGGIGTTLFYVFGGILVAGAVILLVTKKRMAEAE